VARQAVLRRLLVVLAVALDAPAHFQLRGGQTVLPPLGIRNQVELVDLLDRSVAPLARDPCGNVAVVPKFDVLRDAMDLLPDDGLLLFPMLFQRLDARELVVFLGKLGVAAHADLDGRHACGAGPIRPRVAVLTVDLEFASVVFVAEGDRLHRPQRLDLLGQVMGLTGTRRGELLVELCRDLDRDRGIVFVQRPEPVGIADAGRHLGFATARVRDVLAQRGDVECSQHDEDNGKK